VKVTYILLPAVVCALLVGGGGAEAYIGYGYRANQEVRIDLCYRGHAWDYAVPFYLHGPNYRKHRNKCAKERYYYRQYRKKSLK
jgi:hypothetical protein